MAPVVYGYARVSSRDQNLSRQLDAFADFGISAKNVYSDKASGKDFDRPAYKRLMAKLRRGDTLVIKSIDRLGRGYDEILAEWHRISKGRGAFIVVLDMPLLDTRERPGDMPLLPHSPPALQSAALLSRYNGSHMFRFRKPSHPRAIPKGPRVPQVPHPQRV